MRTTTIATLKTTSLNLLKLALLAAMFGGLAAALPANLTRINPTAAVHNGELNAQV